MLDFSGSNTEPAYSLSLCTRVGTSVEDSLFYVYEPGAGYSGYSSVVSMKESISVLVSSSLEFSIF